MSNQKVIHSGGMGLIGWLQILFIGLKLTHYIDWTWLWVLAPLWMSAGLVVAILLIALIVTVVLK